MVPKISVIIPVYNGSATLRLCLDAVAASEFPAYECIVVNDGSTDGSEALARQAGVRVLDISNGPFGPAYARNRGVQLARGEILFFVDADVVLAPGALLRMARLFDAQADVTAAFGSYDDRPAAPSVISQYRNLLHHFVHQNGESEASTFWAGCGAIRRAVFESIGGFDEKRFMRPSIEDIELGYRLRQRGHRIVLDKGLQATHLKSWNLYSLVRTDITCRALPWSRLIMETERLPNDLNLRIAQRISFVLVALTCLLAAFALLEPKLLVGSAAALMGVGIVNRTLYTFFLRRRGPLFALACIPLHFLYYLYSGLSYFWVRAEFWLRRRVIPRKRLPRIAR